MGFMRIFFPRDNVCLFCDGESDDIEGYLCENCTHNLEYLNREIDLNSPYLDRVVFSLFYNNFIREKIHQYKYNGKSYFCKPLSEILINTIEEKYSKENIDVITYVPIHRRKKVLRGYNQSELMAKYISKKLGISLSKENLVKIKRTLVQNKLDRSERRKNLENTFFVRNKEKLKDKEILLIDDIITTGATIEECSKVLIESGAKRVYALAITSGMKL